VLGLSPPAEFDHGWRRQQHQASRLTWLPYTKLGQDLLTVTLRHRRDFLLPFRHRIEGVLESSLAVWVAAMADDEPKPAQSR
jgi:hypothetical protein